MHRIDEQVLQHEWDAQLETQMAPLKCTFSPLDDSFLLTGCCFTDQSKSLGDQAIQHILLLRTEQDDLDYQIVALQRDLVNTSEPDQEATNLEHLQVTKQTLASLESCITNAEKVLGVRPHQKLVALKGNVFLHVRVNANTLKARIWSKLVALKFKWARLEKAYHCQVMSVYCS